MTQVQLDPRRDAALIQTLRERGYDVGAGAADPEPSFPGRTGGGGWTPDDLARLVTPRNAFWAWLAWFTYKYPSWPLWALFWTVIAVLAIAFSVSMGNAPETP